MLILSIVFGCDSGSMPGFITQCLTHSLTNSLSHRMRDIEAECHNSVIFQDRDLIIGKTPLYFLQCYVFENSKARQDKTENYESSRQDQVL